MANEVSLILVHPAAVDDPSAPPRMLIHHKLAWRQMGPATAIQTGQIRRGVDVRLKEAVTDSSLTRLIGRGKELYQDVVPVDARRILHKVSQSGHTLLLIHSMPNNDWIPWEIMHDGEDFLGLKYEIARLPILTASIEFTVKDLGNGETHQVGSIYNVLGQNVVDGPPPGLADIWRETFAQAQTRPGVGLQSVPADLGPGAKWPTARDLDDMQHDIVHITCHGYWDSLSSARVLSLTLQAPQPNAHFLDRDWTTGLDLDTAHPLVFANACGSVGADSAEAMIATAGQQFVEQGAHNFVGSFAPLRKELALDFAKRFYLHLLDPAADLTIGQALLATKKELHNEPAQTDPSYLFYCLYGPPTTRYRLA